MGLVGLWDGGLSDNGYVKPLTEIVAPSLGPVGLSENRPSAQVNPGWSDGKGKRDGEESGSEPP